MNTKIALLVLIMGYSLLGNAQSVGLVLSGGGAKGFAHVGVIRALEEEQIPIDYIAGTSIGAIVGGMYAIGYSPDEMEAILNSEEFIKWSFGMIDKDEEYFYKMNADLPDWLDFQFKKDDDDYLPELPTNVISPFQMDLRFMEFFTAGSANAGNDFNRLMVPFFCIASDVHDGVPVILDSGDLASSIRASMTFPGYFKPISIDSVLLFDGGMENNFPTDIMVERFNPDILIGSKVASNPDKPDSDDIYRQLENVFMEKTNYQMPVNGILIEPRVAKYNLLDFDNYDSIDIKGYEAALEKMDSIKILIKRYTSTDDLQQKREAFKAQNKELIFQNIYITGVDNQTVAYILKSIRRNRSVLTFAEFEEEYFKLLSDKIIKSVYPRTAYNSQSGYFDLYLDIKTKNELSIQVGGNISSNVRNMGYVGVDYIFQKKNIYNLSANTMIGKFYSSFSGKYRMDFAPRKTENDRIITPFYIDIAATIQKYDYFTITSNWFADSESQTKVIQREQHFQSNVGRPINTRSVLYAGFSYGNSNDNYFHTNLIEKSDSPDLTRMDFTSIHLTYEQSTLNYKQYANKGTYFSARARYVTAAETYSPGSTAPDGSPELSRGHSWVNARLKYHNYFKWSSWFTFGINSQLNLSTKESLTNSIATMLDAPVYLPFPQSSTVILDKFRAHNWLGAGVVPIFHIIDRLDIRTEAHIYQPYKYLLTDTFEPTFSEKFPAPRVLASAAVTYQTPLGPIAISTSYFMDEEIPFYFQINFGYLLFNKKGLEY